MLISNIGSSAGDGTTITIPAGHQNGDLLIIFAFRGALTAPTLPAGWTSINSPSSGASSHRCGYKLAQSSSETSGTWTNATGLIVVVYRFITTVKTQIEFKGGTTNTSTSVLYGAGTAQPKSPTTSVLLALSATKTTDSSLETPPTGFSNITTAVGAATEYAAHEANPWVSSTGNFATLTVAVGGTSAEYRAILVEIFSEQIGMENYKFAKDNASGDNGVLSFTEKIR